MSSQLSVDSTESISAPLTPAPKGIGYLSRPLSFSQYPRILFLLPVLLLFNHMVAIVELASASYVNSLGLFSHGSHMIFNGIILAGLITSVFANWSENKRYSLHYIDLVIRVNFIVGWIFLTNSCVMGYMSVRRVIEPPEITHESLFYLMPIPALLLNLLNIYVLVESPDDIDQRTQNLSEDRCNEQSARNVYYHILANACGSTGIILSTVLVQILGWTTADTLCSMFNSVLMFICAVYLIKESIDMTAVIRRMPDVFTVSYNIKNEIQNLSNIFTV